MLIAEDIQIEWDEGGCFLMVDGERWLVSDPETLYDRVKAVIGPWLYERDQEETHYRAMKRRYPETFRCDPDESAGLRDAFEVFSQEDR